MSDAVHDYLFEAHDGQRGLSTAMAKADYPLEAPGAPKGQNKITEGCDGGLQFDTRVQAVAPDGALTTEFLGIESRAGGVCLWLRQ